MTYMTYLHACWTFACAESVERASYLDPFVGISTQPATHAFVKARYIDNSRYLSPSVNIYAPKAISTMIGTSTFDLYLIRSCIFLLYYIAPLCILFCAANVFFYGIKAALSPVALVIESIAISEVLFYLLVYRTYRIRLQREARHPPALSRPERKSLFLQCNANIPNGEAYLQKWFLGAPASEIKRDNLKDFFLWAFFNREGPPGNDDEELEEYITLTEELLGRDIKPGRGSAECLRLTLDRVDMMHRTLVWYLVSLHLLPGQEKN
jgi:hypothetical protein